MVQLVVATCLYWRGLMYYWFGGSFEEAPFLRGPDELQRRNPRLVIARLTGYGQTGPYAPAVGHDINYISLSGALATFARSGSECPPGM